LDGSGSHAIYRNPIRSQLHGRHSSEHLNAPFAGGVADELGKWNLVAAGSNVNDSSTSLLLHMPAGALGTKKDTLKIGINHTIPLWLFQFKQGFPNLCAGIVNQNGESRESRQHFLKYLGNVCRTADVPANRQCPPS